MVRVDVAMRIKGSIMVSAISKYSLDIKFYAINAVVLYRFFLYLVINLLHYNLASPTIQLYPCLQESNQKCSGW